MVYPKVLLPLNFIILACTSDNLDMHSRDSGAHAPHQAGVPATETGSNDAWSVSKGIGASALTGCSYGGEDSHLACRSLQTAWGSTGTGST